MKCDAGGLFFQWRPVEGAAHYRYRLLSKGERILQSRTSNTSVHLGAGNSGQRYTARVRAKTDSGISKWASVKAKCPKATPTPAPSVSFSISYLSRDIVIFDWSWKRLPADTKWIYIAIRADDDKDCDASIELFHPFEEGEGHKSYQGLCPNTDHHLEFATVDNLGYFRSIKKEHFRTLP